jgi:D-arabinose 1-dehydrogenase-like Zn-dependent alcohol dehydrogenase
MKVVQAPKAGTDFEIVEREIPQPGPGHVRIRVQACGICPSDAVTKEGLFPGITYPRVPGHEVASVIDEVGAGVKEWQNGKRVGVGWHGGQDGTCLAWRRGDFVNCANAKDCGISDDGGYQEYLVAPVEALARIPDRLKCEHGMIVGQRSHRFTKSQDMKIAGKVQTPFRRNRMILRRGRWCSPTDSAAE